MTASLTRRLLAAASVVVALTLTGCGGDGEPTAVATPSAATFHAKTVKAASLRAGQPVPVPAGKPVLTVTGKIGAPNQGKELVLDRVQLDRLGLLQVNLYEPWQKTRLDFRGVWLADLLAVAGIDPAAQSLHIVALDDYQVDIPMADVRAGGILLATQLGDGTAIPVATGGPTRIVFMDGVKSGANQDQWIWSLARIEVR